jgi:hypothetical protein
VRFLRFPSLLNVPSGFCGNVPAPRAVSARVPKFKSFRTRLIRLKRGRGGDASLSGLTSSLQQDGSCQSLPSPAATRPEHSIPKHRASPRPGWFVRSNSFEQTTLRREKGLTYCYDRTNHPNRAGVDAGRLPGTVPATKTGEGKRCRTAA